MRVNVISDVHGHAEALPAAGAGADALICLGDLLLFVAYADHSRGIFAELFGADAICHLTGYWRYLGGSGAVIVPRDGLPTLVLSRDEEGLVRVNAALASIFVIRASASGERTIVA